MATPLYQLAGDRERMLALVADQDGELTPEQEAELAALDLGIAERAEACIARIRIAELRAEATKAEITRLGAVMASAQAEAEKVRRYLQAQLERMDLDGVTTHLGKVSIRQNPPKVAAELVPAAAAVLLADLLEEQGPEFLDWSDPETGEPCAPAWARALGAEGIRAVAGCVKTVDPVPAQQVWDKDALKKLAKTTPDLVAHVARIERGTTLSIK